MYFIILIILYYIILNILAKKKFVNPHTIPIHQDKG